MTSPESTSAFKPKSGLGAASEANAAAKSFKNQRTVSVLIPAYNEAERIGATIAAVRLIPGVTEIVVVDDGSSDETAQRAETAGADVVLRQENRGKGAALQAAYLLSTGEILLLVDADLGASANEAALLLEPVINDAAGMTIATFPVGAGSGGGVGLVVGLARWGIRRLTGRTMTAPLSGQRALRRQLIADVGGFAAGWGAEVALTVGALQANYQVREVPTSMSHRVTGHNLTGILHRGAQFIAVAKILWQMRTASSSRKEENSTGAVIKRNG